MDKNKVQLQSSALNKQLWHLLSIFEKNKEWADLSSWLQKVEAAMNAHPSHLITEKLSLSKRLAQCLNPSIPPGIHLSTLKIYELIFKNMSAAVGGFNEEYVKIFTEVLSIYSVGLFPFFPNASSKVKFVFLELINNYFIPLKRDLIPCLPGLISSLIPGLEETSSEQLTKELHKTFNKIMEVVGRRYFIGTLWMAIFRIQRGRAQAIKYLSSIIPKKQNKEDEEEYQQQQDDSEGESKQSSQVKDNFKLDEENQRQDNHNDEQNVVQQQGEGSEEEDQEDVEEEQEQEEGEQQKELDQKQNEEVQVFKQQSIKEQINQKDLALQQSDELQQQSSQHQQQTIDTNAINQEQKLQQSSTITQAIIEKVVEPESQEIVERYSYRTQAMKLIEEGINQMSPEIDFPNKSSLILNTLIHCLEDENQIVKRNILDFMYSHLKVGDSLFSDQDRLILVEAVMYLMVKKDASITRRVNMWLFGKPDLENKYPITEANMKVLPFIMSAVKNIYAAPPTDSASGTRPLKILQNFFMEHEHLIENTLKELSHSILVYIYKYHEGREFSSEVLKQGQRFMENIPSYFDLVLTSLADQAIALISQHKDADCLMVINLIEFTYDKLLGDSTYLEPSIAQTCVHATISGIIKAFSSITVNEVQTLTVIYPALSLIFKLLIKLEQIDHQLAQGLNVSGKLLQQQQMQQINQLSNSQQQQNCALSMDNAIQEYDTFYSKITTSLQEHSNQRMEQVFRIASRIVVRIQKKLSSKDQITALPNWFKCITQCIKLTSPSISLVAIESMISILISEKVDPVYEKLKTLIIDESRAKFSKQNETIVGGNDYTKVTLEKLWSLLDFQHFHDKIIDLIVNFSNYFPQFFKEVVISSFQVHSITEKEAAIRRFAVFWRLTQQQKDLAVLSTNIKDQASIQQQMIPTMSELNKVGLFIMLEFLENENPLLRHASKNWLIESIPQFYRIIDPLFEVLLKANSACYITDMGQAVYAKVYQTRIVSDTFRKLKSILINASESFTRSISTTPLSSVIEELKINFTDQSDTVLYLSSYSQTSTTTTTASNNIGGPNDNYEVNQQNKSSSMMYLDLLVVISLRYIQGQALESLGLKFHIENAAVNASSCEFLEMLIQHVEDPQLSLLLCDYVLEPLMSILYFSITNMDYVMQLQLLNLLKVIFFSSSFTQKNSEHIVKPKLYRVLSSQIFIPNILRGIHTPISYVRSQFLSFISDCIPFISKYLPHQNLTQAVKQIMLGYLGLIKDLAEGRTEEKNATTGVMDAREALLAQQEELKSSSTQYEIFNVLDGVQVILRFFLKVQSLEEIQTAPQVQTSSLLSTLTSVITLGMLGGSNNTSSTSQSDSNQSNSIPLPSQYTSQSAAALQRLQQREQSKTVVFDHFQETCECLLYDIKQVVEIFVNGWYQTKEFSDLNASTTSLGSRAYEFEKFNNFNTALGGLMAEAYSKRQRVQHICLSIMKPLFYRFPVEILDALLALWNRDLAKPGRGGGGGGGPPHSLDDFQLNPFLLKMIEMMVIMNINMELFLVAASHCFVAEKVQQYYSKKHPKDKKNVLFALSYEMACLESRTLYFFYLYFSSVAIDAASLKRENLLTYWFSVLRLLRIFAVSKNPSTQLWLLEIMHMLSIKYSPKEIVSDTRFKKELHNLINEKLYFLAQIGSKQVNFLFNEPLQSIQTSKSGTGTAATKSAVPMQVQEALQYCIVTPFSPTIYDLCLKYFQTQYILKIQIQQKKQTSFQNLVKQQSNESPVSSPAKEAIQSQQKQTQFDQNSPSLPLVKQLSQSSSLQQQQAYQLSPMELATGQQQLEFILINNKGLQIDQKQQSQIDEEMFGSFLNLDSIASNKQDNQAPQKIQASILQSEEQLHIKYRLFIWRTLQNIALDLLFNTYSPESVGRVAVRTREFIDPVLPLLEQKGVKDTDSDAVFFETASLVLHSLIQKHSTLLIPQFSKNILNIFDKDNFFQCNNQQTIKYWGHIIDWVATYDQQSDIFLLYLEKVTLTTSFFVKESTENKRRIKAFMRVCFIIFMGERDKYVNKLKELLNKISDVIKNSETANHLLLILILFCIRILIIRLKEASLNNLFRQIWPLLLTLLISVFSKPSLSSSQQQQTGGSTTTQQPNKSVNLMLAGLKLIELLSAIQIEEFYLHQWMFVFDYFGLKIEEAAQIKPFTLNNDYGGTIVTQNPSTISEPESNSKMTPFLLQPYITNCLPSKDFKVNYINQQYKDEQQIQYKKRNRRLIMVQARVEDETQLKAQALWLCQYILQSNEFRMELDYNDVESLIEQDFLQLEEFIMQEFLPHQKQ